MRNSECSQRAVRKECPEQDHQDGHRHFLQESQRSVVTSSAGKAKAGATVNCRAGFGKGGLALFCALVG
jgi:hypothetical protein